MRVVADSRLRLPLSAEVVRTAHKVATWVVTGPHGAAGRRQDLLGAGVQVIEVASGSDGRPDARGMAARSPSAALPACCWRAAVSWRRRSFVPA